MKRNLYIPLVLAALLAGCETGGGGSGASANRTAGEGDRRPSAEQRGASPVGQPVAYLDGTPVSLSDLRTGLLEAAGGQAMAEWLLDRKLEQELRRRDLTVGPTLRDAERRILANMLSDDPDEAERLILELRQRRGLGERRFEQLMHRSAALRLLIQNEVEISEPAVQQAFELQYGPRYEARLILAENLADAGRIVTRARQGESFVDLAVNHSIDTSRAQGGRLPPISPADPTFPDVVRTALQRMEPGDISDAIALERGFAVLKLESITPGRDIELEQVRDRVTRSVRRQVEDMLMRRKRAALIDETDIVILDRSLDESWQTWQRMNRN